jgi:hypothetical protein
VNPGGTGPGNPNGAQGPANTASNGAANPSGAANSATGNPASPAASGQQGSPTTSFRLNAGDNQASPASYKGQGATPAQPGQDPSGGSQGGQGTGQGSSDWEAAMGGSSSPDSTPTEKRPRPKAPASWSNVTTNHDFVIDIVCVPEGVFLKSMNEWYKMDPPENQKAAAAALVQRVQNMVARRQATVREGEPLYQPKIRLQVVPDGGMRGCMWIWPPLSTLNIPTTRTNLLN